jgi:hypothetical protein
MPGENEANSPNAQVNLRDALQPLVSALVKAIENEQTPEMIELRTMFLRRVILSGDIVPSRAPAPLNVTEIGGYLNYLRDNGQAGMALTTAASVLGIAVPLSSDEQKMLTHSQSNDLGSVLQRELSATSGWIAVCEENHSFWKANVASSFNKARLEADAHDRSVHRGIPTAAVLSI